VIGIEEDPNPNARGPRLLAIKFDQEEIEKVDANTAAHSAHLLATYDPAHEIIIQFKDFDGGVRTQLLRTDPDAQHPKRLYFFEMLRRVQEEPESINPGDLPEWFVQALERLDAMAKEKEESDSMEAVLV
jgi:hypothetical protein